MSDHLPQIATNPLLEPNSSRTALAPGRARMNREELGSMAVKLHRCSLMFIKVDGHACWRVQKALDEQGVDYEVVKVPIRRGARTEVESLSGQKVVPMIEFEDGTAYRAESKEMAARIREGSLLDGHEAAAG